MATIGINRVAEHRLDIYDLQGNTVFRSTAGLARTYHIDLGRYGTGAYVAELRCDGRRHVEPFVVK